MMACVVTATPAAAPPVATYFFCLALFYSFLLSIAALNGCFSILLSILACSFLLRSRWLLHSTGARYQRQCPFGYYWLTAGWSGSSVLSSRRPFHSSDGPMQRLPRQLGFLPCSSRRSRFISASLLERHLTDA